MTFLREAASAIFKTFLETRLAPPDGSRRREVEEEIEEAEEQDRYLGIHIYCSQLCSYLAGHSLLFLVIAH